MSHLSIDCFLIGMYIHVFVHAFLKSQVVWRFVRPKLSFDLHLATHDFSYIVKVNIIMVHHKVNNITYHLFLRQ